MRICGQYYLQYFNIWPIVGNMMRFYETLLVEIGYRTLKRIL